MTRINREVSHFLHYQAAYVLTLCSRKFEAGSRKPGKKKMREEGIEPTTAGSGIQCSTTELFPHRNYSTVTHPDLQHIVTVFCNSLVVMRALRLQYIRTGPDTFGCTRHGAPCRSTVPDSAFDQAIHQLGALRLLSVILLKLYNSARWCNMCVRAGTISGWKGAYGSA
jgi:hypothetical protein